jgi:2-polyprenyl-3-methyl-5-hydroxy-6-metoxy-1,4-benzoquinol methylase
MINLTKRSYTKELMDGDNIPFDAMAKTLKELNTVNTYLGGHAITLKGIQRLLKPNEQMTICEIGCGGGDNLAAVHKYYAAKNIKPLFIGIDMNPGCIAFARQRYKDLPCEWICSDYAAVTFTEKPDIIFSSLFCHHFTDEELKQMMQWLNSNSATGFFINDLQRHWLAYVLIKYITKIFSRSHLVRNDACLSVARSFRYNEWEDLLTKAGLSDYSISWQWAFRYLVSVKK